MGYQEDSICGFLIEVAGVGEYTPEVLEALEQNLKEFALRYEKNERETVLECLQRLNLNYYFMELYGGAETITKDDCDGRYICNHKTLGQNDYLIRQLCQMKWETFLPGVEVPEVVIGRTDWKEHRDNAQNP